MADVVYKPSRPYKQQYNTPVLQQKEFSQNWVEWAGKKRTHVSPAVIISGLGSATLYTVPNDFILFVTNASMSLTCNGAGVGGMTYAALGINNTSIAFCVLACRSNETVNMATNQNFSSPIKIDSGSNIVLTNHIVNLTSSGIITGWLEPKTSV